MNILEKEKRWIRQEVSLNEILSIIKLQALHWDSDTASAV